MKISYLFQPLVLSLLLLISLSCGSASDKRDKIEEEQSLVKQLVVKGTSLKDETGNDVVLKGVSLGWHNWWSRFFNQKTITWLNQDWNCNLVRAAIGVGPDGAYTDNKELAYQCLYSVVDAAIANDMYVIVDWHSHEIRLDEAKEFFTQVATKYKGRPNVIYEVFNEPVEQSWDEVKAYAEEVIKTIRAIDPHNLILVGCPHWDQDIHLVADAPIQGYDNLMYTVHFYAGTHKQELRDRCDYALSKGIPIFISECAGMNADGDGPINYQEWMLWQQWMAQKKISWVAWSLADKNESCSMIYDHNSPISNWKETDLKEWGKEIRNTLKNQK